MFKTRYHITKRIGDSFQYWWPFGKDKDQCVDFLIARKRYELEKSKLPTHEFRLVKCVISPDNQIQTTIVEVSPLQPDENAGKGEEL